MFRASGPVGEIYHVGWRYLFWFLLGLYVPGKFVCFPFLPRREDIVG